MSLFIFTLSVQANQLPSKEQIASYKKDVSLYRLISQAKNYGTFKFNRGLVVKAQRRLQQLSQNS